MPSTVGTNVYDQVSRPIAGCHEAPPSTDTSTAATRPPPLSTAVPDSVTADPISSDDPGAGDTRVDTGGNVSVDFVAATSPLWRLVG